VNDEYMEFKGDGRFCKKQKISIRKTNQLSFRLSYNILSELNSTRDLRGLLSMQILHTCQIASAFVPKKEEEEKKKNYICVTSHKESAYVDHVVSIFLDHFFFGSIRMV
jgi:hypothetical protein